MKYLAPALVLALAAATACVPPDDPTIDDEAVGENPASLAAIGPPNSTQFTMVPRGSHWGFKNDGVDQGTAWRSEAAHDYDRWIDPWPEATAPIGYGESYLATTIPFGPDPAHKPVTSYFRRFFYLQLPAQKLYLRVMYDDGFVFYINGKEGGRASMPSGPVNAQTRALSHEAGAKYITFDISSQIPNMRQSGDNTLSFEVHQADPSSSDLVFDAELIAWSDGNYVNPGANEISDHDYWSFWDRGGDLGTEWRLSSYNEGHWSAAPAPLGFGETYLGGELSPGPITTYFRKDFFVGAEAIFGLYADVLYDDGFVAYLNGHEIARRAMPSGPVNASTLSSGHEAGNVYERIPLSLQNLEYVKTNDLNQIAVEVHQSSASSSDLVFDLALRLERVWKLLADRSPGPLHGVWFFSPQFGLVVGDQGTIKYTQDNGEHFTKVASGTFEDLTAITFVDAYHGWIVGAGATALRSDDGGLSWSAVDVATATGTTPTFRSVDFVSVMTGFVLGDTSFFRTSDGGNTWASLPLPDGSVMDLDFVDAQNGWVVGYTEFENDTRGAIWLTTDGGLTWTRQWVAPNHNHILYDVEALDASTAWAVGVRSLAGTGSVLLTTHDGGVSWAWPSSGSDAGLLAIDFVDASFGWAVGVGGLISHTEDGGVTWDVQVESFLFFKPWLEDVHFVDRHYGWAVGAFAGLGDERGLVMRTSTGGK